MAKNMRWARKIGEGILVGPKQKRKKGNKNREEYLGG
jgi:hypothetical protein